MKLLARKLNEKAFNKAAKSTTTAYMIVGTYQVFTSTKNYTVTVIKNSAGEDLVECECQAASFGNPCYHAAAGYTKHLELRETYSVTRYFSSLFSETELAQFNAKFAIK